jgi:arylsulfatase A-like enzyme
MPQAASRAKRAVLVIWDSLRADLIGPQFTPRLAEAQTSFCRFSAHTTVFPSTTRAASASIATGFHPARHGLHGNAMALDEGRGLVCLSTGKADFRERLRKAKGRTLFAPTLAERLANAGGCIVFSNASPGAAFFQDPDGHGFLYNRAGSHGPGFSPVPPGEELTAPKGIEGDRAATDRFCEEVLARKQPALAVLWLSEPDNTGHRNPICGPAHRDAMSASDACFAHVLEYVDRHLGDNTLVVTGSDHGQETTARVIPVEQFLVDAGLKQDLDSSDVVVAPQGTAALVYVSEQARPRVGELRRFFESQDWIGSVAGGGELRALGQDPGDSLALAVSMRKSGASNPYGVPGLSDLMLDRTEDLNHVGCGQHGGLGPWEMNPFLNVRGPGFRPGTSRTERTCVTDIAPTILRHLGQPSVGMDGVPLQE